MKNAVISGILIAAAGTLMPQSRSASAAPNEVPFHWDYRTADRLDSGRSVAEETGLTSADRAALIAALAAQMRDWKLGSEQQVRGIAADIPIKLVDLNGDGKPEVIAQLIGVPGACGAPGNCILWVFRRDRNSYSLLLDDEAQVFRIQTQRTKGYRDIVLSIHMSAFDSEVREFKFDGKQYQASECYDFQWADGATGREFTKPHFTRCKQ